RRVRARIEQEFASAAVRPASHAGGAYYDDPADLAEYLDVECLGIPRAKSTTDRAPTFSRARKRRPPINPPSTNGTTLQTNGSIPFPKIGSGRLVALVAPYIDPWRGARCYGAAYRALEVVFPDDVDMFILVGTSHAPMREPYALCRKAFDT